MKKTKMIIFDYGHTLLHEPGFDLLKGYCALYPYIKSNPKGYSPEQINAIGKELSDKVYGVRKTNDLEFHEYQILRMELEYMGIELSVPLEEAEIILWNGVSPGAQMPYVEELLETLKKLGIRSGVISNLSWSGRALTERINRLLPENQFEFILASSEYIYRKPDPYLFELALCKANLERDEVWYCGDTLEADIVGAYNAGIFPVWYVQEGKEAEQEPDFPHMKIRDLRELIQVLM